MTSPAGDPSAAVPPPTATNPESASSSLPDRGRLEIPDDPHAAARAAGLRYVSDDRPGIGRLEARDGFHYVDAEGRPVRDADTLARIKGLAIPPAWTDIWICPVPNGHIQATGRDARGRKQYRYHPSWRRARDETKYLRMLAFGRALPRIRERVDEDLGRPGLPREKVLAAVVELLARTFIRVGNEEYARENRSFGLTTLRDRHARIEGSEIRLRFRGKAGKEHEMDLRDRRLARVVRRCQELPGQELFQYETPDGGHESIDSGDVNEYLREITGQDFTAKDFRTWAGTLLAYRALRALQPADTKTAARKNVVEAIKDVAEELGNTPAVARKSYVHPAVLEAYLDGGVGDALATAAEDQQTPPPQADEDEEEAVIDLLEQRLERSAAELPSPSGAGRTSKRASRRGGGPSPLPRS